MDISLSDLKYFLKTAELQNISKAALELGIRQPSLSQAMKKMEESLDVTLFHRSKKGVSLTREGKALYLRSRTMLDYWHETEAEVSGVKHSLTGLIRFGCHPSVGLFTLRYFLPTFLKKHTKVDFEIVNGHSREITKQVINSEIDMAIVVNPIDHPDLVKIKLYEDDVCLWSKGSIDGKPLIMDPDLLQSKELEKKIKKMKLKINRKISVSSLENIVSLVASGVGVGIIPSRVVKESGKKIIKLKEIPIFKDEHFLIYRFENRKLKIFSELKEYILEGLKN